MKIGIMTWWRNTNYGGFLQGLALQTFLLKNGFDVELIRYAFPNVNFSAGRLISLRRISRPWHILIYAFDVVRSLFLNGAFFARLKRLKKTLVLFDKHVRSSPACYSSISELNDDRRYGTILIGSDQVWTPYFHDAEFSYLLRGLDPCVRKVSYAASVAATSVHPYEKIYAEGLSAFDAISIREKTNIEESERLSGKRVRWVVDPTLLLSADEWRELLALNDKTAERHITFYFLSDFRGRISELVKLAKAHSCKVHIFTDVLAFSVTANPLTWIRHLIARVRIACSPWLTLRLDADAREWLQDLSTADYVLSDSFHALMFATIFKRNMKIEIPPTKVFMGSRITDFRSCPDLEKWSESSRAWLLEALEFRKSAPKVNQ